MRTGMMNAATKDERRTEKVCQVLSSTVVARHRDGCTARCRLSPQSELWQGVDTAFGRDRCFEVDCEGMRTGVELGGC
jgi:hypothetical protein